MNKLKTYALGLALTAVYSGCTTLADNSVKTVANAALIPYKVVQGTVEDFNPVQGAKYGVLDTIEQTGVTLANIETPRHPLERGSISDQISEKPLLNSATNIGAAALGAWGIAEWTGAKPSEVRRAVGYSAAGQTLLEVILNKK